MVPRFANPHLLPRLAPTISTRAEVYAEHWDEDLGWGGEEEGESIAVEELNGLIGKRLRYTLPAPAAANLGVGTSGSSAVAAEEVGEKDGELLDDLVLFRLVSSSQPPLPLSLLPPPPPLSKTREPDSEDSEEQAVLRKQYAEASAISGAQVLLELETLKATSKDADIQLQLQTPGTKKGKQSAHTMVIRTLQPPRKTTPPVPAAERSQYPYISDVSTLPTQPPISKIPGCLTADAHLVTSVAGPERSPRRRRRGAPVEKKRPPPQFWRPGPEMKGKCRGYAYGYPASLSTEYLGVWKYRRDTMKKAVYSNDSVASDFRRN